MTGYNTTENQLFIVETQPPFERLAIQFVPESLPKSRTADLATVAVVGRNNPHYHLTGGEDRLSLKLDFLAERESREDVIQKVQWLESLTMNDGYRGPVRNVKLVWGKLYRREVWVVKDVKSDLSQFMHTSGWLPQQATVEITLLLDPKKNRTLSDVRR